MKPTLIFSAIALTLFTACDSVPSDSGTIESSGCIITVENNEILATRECDLDGDGVDQWMP